ncbi:MAG: LysR family transcriptional regulator [Clostridiales bacterium]|nr:LysR family transcriptional regulator [Clostridiales bacterium]
MNLNQLKYFSEAVKYRSISTAARENFVTQSTFSTAITNLEDELSVKLLNRGVQGVTPTCVGEQVFYKVHDLLMLLEDIRILTSQSSKAVSLRIASLPSLIDTLLADTILYLEAKNHDLMLDIISDDSEGVQAKIQGGHSDIGVIFTDGFPIFPGLAYEPLFASRYVLFVGKHHPMYCKEELTIEEALSLKHVTYKNEYVKEYDLLTHLTRSYGKPKISLCVDNNESMHRIISRSDYVAFFPEFVTRHDAYIESENISMLNVSNADLNLQIGVVYSKKYGSKEKISSFIEILKCVLIEEEYL